MAEIKNKMFCPLTPRRKILHFDTVSKRTNFPCPPLAAPDESPSAIETCRTNITWWESVLNWLQDKDSMIDESLGKDPEDLIVLSSGPEMMTLSGGSGKYNLPLLVIKRFTYSVSKLMAKLVCKKVYIIDEK
jgi:hypothetical protein